ncbi:MAG TPA: cisplatin damage response ATP-dependent DNA ligase, partial [Rhizomicrobium sp.]|nr:cisplatin damage response ATP-dependent DNA ligase [Rhizomicrobium sp.]
MRAFAQLLDRLAFTPQRNGKLTLLHDYFRDTPDPERGWALASLTGDMTFDAAKPAFIRKAVEARMDPQLFALSYEYVGDLAETVALTWPAKPGANREPELPEVVDALRGASRAQVQKLIEGWLDALDADGRWALLKLLTGGLRVGVSARLAKQALANLGGVDVSGIEEVWHSQHPPYEDLFAWLEKRSDKPTADAPGRFRPVMLAHAIEDSDFAKLDPKDFSAEWKWDGIRVQAVAGRDARGHLQTRLYSRTGEDITKSFPDITPSLHLPGAIDGELLVVRDGRVQSFNVLQQRLNRKVVSPKLTKEYPMHLRAYDLLSDGDNDLRELPFAERREKLEAFVKLLGDPRIDLSPTIAFDSWEALREARA